LAVRYTHNVDYIALVYQVQNFSSYSVRCMFQLQHTKVGCDFKKSLQKYRPKRNFQQCVHCSHMLSNHEISIQWTVRPIYWLLSLKIWNGFVGK